MQIFKSIKTLRHFLQEAKLQGKKIGFVPTMGALHEGHLSLIRKAEEDNDLTVCSVYVNPIQFNNQEDYQKYPRDPEQDKKILEKENVDVLFLPEDKIMYSGKSSVVKFDFGRLEKIMEGKFRPGHFNGVATVVLKLLNIVLPNHVYFGRKDLQQAVVIKTMINDLFIASKMELAPIARREDGLALSSRNNRLTEKENRLAPRIYQTLVKAKQLLLEKKSIIDVKKFVEETMQQDNAFQLEYFEVVDFATLETVQNIHHHQEVALCIAVYLGEVRLIDNMLLFSSV